MKFLIKASVKNLILTVVPIDSIEHVNRWERFVYYSTISRLLNMSVTNRSVVSGSYLPT